MDTEDRFRQFVDRRQPDPSAEVIDWQARVHEWLGALERLYADIEGWLETHVASGRIVVGYTDITIDEEAVGRYPARAMRIRIGNSDIEIVPAGTNLIAARGRVDVAGGGGRARIVLVNPDASTPASMIGLVEDDEGMSRAAAIDGCVWKLATMPPRQTLIRLDRETFLEMLMDVGEG